jgi:plasmid stabilization system protein ParE
LSLCLGLKLGQEFSIPVPVEVRLHPDAEQELRNAYLWYLERSSAVAESFIAEVDHAIGVVGDKPVRWPRLTKSLRRYVFPRFPFSLVYRVKPAYVEVIAIAHQKKRPGYWQHR